MLQKVTTVIIDDDPGDIIDDGLGAIINDGFQANNNIDQIIIDDLVNDDDGEAAHDSKKTLR